LRELSLHILDIAENSISAGATCVEIKVNRDFLNDELWISVKDNGKGMDEDLTKMVTNPFVTTRTSRKVGLGIPMFKQAAESCKGYLTIRSQLSQGTEILAKFQNSHINRMPLGNLSDTFLSLLLATPNVNWVFSYQINDVIFNFDDAEVKEAMDPLHLTDYRVISYLTNTIQNGINEVNQAVKGEINANN
jgi:hypothetical protein